MKFLQQLDPLVETHTTAIEDKLDESSVIRTLDQIRKYTARDIADFAFLHFLILFIMQEDPELATAASGHARRIISIGDFKKLTFIGTDLYVYLHLLLGGNRDRLKPSLQNEAFFKHCHLSERDLRSMLMDIAENRFEEAKKARFLLMLEKNLQIDNAGYRSCRRQITHWAQQEPYSQKLVISRIKQALSSRCPNSDLLPHLQTFNWSKVCQVKEQIQLSEFNDKGEE